MEKNTTNILLVIIAIFLGFISYQLVTNKKTENGNQKNTVAEEQKKGSTAQLVSTSITHTKDFSFASWNNTTNKISTDPETYILFNNKDTDPFLEKVVYTKNNKALTSNPSNDSNYSFVSNATFGVNTYEIYEQKETKTRVFVLKKNSEALLVYLSDSNTLVPHYVDLSSLKFTSR